MGMGDTFHDHRRVWVIEETNSYKCGYPEKGIKVRVLGAGLIRDLKSREVNRLLDTESLETEVTPGENILHKNYLGQWT